MMPRDSPRWFDTPTADPRGEVLLGLRLERSTWWVPVTSEPPPMKLLDDQAVMPMVTRPHLDPGVAPVSRLAEDAGRISALGVSALDHDIGAPRSLAVTTDLGFAAISPWTTSPEWRQ
jgi:hypothetical protein